MPLSLLDLLLCFLPHHQDRVACPFLLLHHLCKVSGKNILFSYANHLLVLSWLLDSFALYLLSMHLCIFLLLHCISWGCEKKEGSFTANHLQKQNFQAVIQEGNDDEGDFENNAHHNRKDRRCSLFGIFKTRQGKVEGKTQRLRDHKEWNNTVREQVVIEVSREIF